MSMNYVDRIPNNVGLSDNRRLQRALESWQPNYMKWWHEMGPDGSTDFDVYLRTAISVETDGWANFGFVKMPEYRWGIFLAKPDPRPRYILRRPPGGPGVAGGPGRVPRPTQAAHRDSGRYGTGVGGAATPAGADLSVALRPAQPVPDQRGGGAAPVGHGLPAARLLRPGRSRGGRGDAGNGTPAMPTAPASLERSTRPPQTGCRT